MHTYRKEGDFWQAGYQYAEEPRFNPLGPLFTQECEAAAFASFLNGGRYSPGEIELVFVVVPPEEADDEPEDHTTPPSKSRFSDYPQEGLQARK